MAEKYPEPLLDLNTLIERPKITIDGLAYEIASPDELSVLDTQRLAWLGRKLDNLMKQDGAASAKALGDTLEEITARVMEQVPAAVRDQLSDAKKLAVIDVFTMLSLTRKMQLAGAAIPQIIELLQKTAKPAAGVKQPPGSSDSTAALPQDG